MKILKSDYNRLAGLITFCGVILSTSASLRAQSVYTINNTVADAFLAAGAPGNPVGTNLTSLNFGSAGTLAIAPAGSVKGEFDSVIQFNTAAAVSQFNTTYGAGNWQVTAITLSLASNFGTQGVQPNNGIFNTINAGQFGIDWLANNGWVEGTGAGMGGSGYPNNSSVSFNSISSLFSGGSASLGTFRYTPPGNNIYENYSLPLNTSLVSGAAAGGGVSLYFYAADNQVSYLFNSKEFNSNHPELTITATAVPEPGRLALATSALACLMISRRLKQRS
jgi:hypothetical protein